MPRSRWRSPPSTKRKRNAKPKPCFSRRVDLRRNDTAACFRTLDMIGNVVLLNGTVFHPAKQDTVHDIFDRFSNKDPLCLEDTVADALEAKRNEQNDPDDATTAMSIPTATSTSTTTETETETETLNATTTVSRIQQSRDPEEITHERHRIYSEAFLKSCAELASYSDNACHREHRRTSWFSRFRRRCSSVRDWLPTMCSCLDGSSVFLDRSVTRVGNYHRLGGKSNFFEFDRTMEESKRNRYVDIGDDLVEEVEELRFYNDDLTWNTLLVERNLRTVDLCQLLKVKRSVSGIDWSIVETWPELGIERTLEDHEDISAVHREMKMFASQHERKFFFRLDYLKYEFFFDPKQFFPTDMVAFPAAFTDHDGTVTDAEIALRQENGECPQVFSLVWIRIGHLDVWRRTHMLLRDRKLYLAKKDNEQLIPLAHLLDYVVYKITNAKKRFKAPFEWGVCLRPSCNAEAENTVAGESGLKVIAFHSEKSRVCWLTAMRLAKYGKQLRENYRAFKNKQCEQSGGENPKERYVNYNVSNESARSRVAMDFTGSVGRIVEDPKEAKNIAESEGVNWRRTWRPFSRTPPGCAVVRLHGLDDGIHVLQPWFHRGLKRDMAAAIVRDHGSVDGVFLVRESKSNLGAYVLTYKYSDRVFHAQIQPVFDERCNCWLYTLDKGITKFYDLLQLIEFYQLNAGCLPTRLTHYVQNGVPAPVPRPEDGGASPSPPELGHRFANVAATGATGFASTAGHRSI
ncbi:growth factor receptor-bound protein 14-like isoform X2 [Osmia bicornis bicornis]|uniref:growth factor receptor-bound protein 14-like isoform X2 n=1 Tax=Osmia bicornis bicornis TaxID=1437191 RepID=UPI0010F8685B|nr:growth factor receptor-bound protein 14-like isoform X2 [Osmia bicornis bicornis]